MHSCWTESKGLKNVNEFRDLGKHTFRGVLKTQIADSAKQFGFQEEIPREL